MTMTMNNMTYSTVAIFKCALVLLPFFVSMCFSASINHIPSIHTSSNNSSQTETNPTSVFNASSSNLDQMQTKPKHSTLLAKLGLGGSETTQPTQQPDHDSQTTITPESYPKRIRRSIDCQPNTNLSQILQDYNNDHLKEKFLRVLLNGIEEVNNTNTTVYDMRVGGNLCPQWLATTYLPSNIYPRTPLREIICDDTTNHSCHQNSHGHNVGCIQMTYDIKLLKRMSYCTASIENGVSIWVEEWIPYTKTVRVGCQCERITQRHAG